MHADSMLSHMLNPCVRVHLGSDLTLRSDRAHASHTRMERQRAMEAGSSHFRLHARARTAQGCERVRMRCPWTVGIVVGREECARSDLRVFVTYSQILLYWGCGYSQSHSACSLWPLHLLTSEHRGETETVWVMNRVNTHEYLVNKSIMNMNR